MSEKDPSSSSGQGKRKYVKNKRKHVGMPKKRKRSPEALVTVTPICFIKYWVYLKPVLVIFLFLLRMLLAVPWNLLAKEKEMSQATHKCGT